MAVVMDFFDFDNPFMPYGYDPFEGMSTDERLRAGCLQGVIYVVVMTVGLLICALL